MDERGFGRYVSVFILVSAFALSSVLSLASRTAQASPDETEWVREFGSDWTDIAAEVALDASGVYVSGRTIGTLPGQYSMGGWDGFIRKYDFTGNELWTSQFGSTEFDWTHGIAVGASGVYVVGITTGNLENNLNLGGEDAFVRKCDFNGNHVWTRQFGTTAWDGALGVAVDSSGVYVVGWTNATLPGQVSAGYDDAFLRKYDFNGFEVWTRQFGSPSGDTGFDVAIDASGVYVSGDTYGALPGQTSAGDLDAFIRKFDRNGNTLWTSQYGTSSSDNAWSIAAYGSNIYTLGVTYGAFPGQANAGWLDSYVRASDLNGNPRWLRQFGSALNDSGESVAVNYAGVYVTGYTEGALPGQTNLGSNDAFVLKFDLDGNELWTRQFGSAFEDLAAGNAVDSSGLYVVGETRGVFAGQTSPGLGDAFVYRMGLDYAPGPLRAVLAGKSAWPAHHHFVVSKHGLDQTLYGEVANVGSAPVSAAVVFTITDSYGDWIAEVSSDVVRVAPGVKLTVTALWPVALGSYDVMARCWYDTNDDGSLEGVDLDAKSFSFKVVP